MCPEAWGSFKVDTGWKQASQTAVQPLVMENRIAINPAFQSEIGFNFASRWSRQTQVQLGVFQKPGVQLRWIK